MGKFGILIAIVMLVSVLEAANCPAGPLQKVCESINNLCWGLKNLLPIAAMLGIVLAGVIYAAGQMMGAETRARANVWATAALTGALIAILMAVVAPVVLQTIYGTTGTIGCT